MPRIGSVLASVAGLDPADDDPGRESSARRGTDDGRVMSPAAGVVWRALSAAVPGMES